MDTNDFMPGDDTIAAIRQDIERYEQERASAHRQIMWRVPVFLLSTLAVVALLAIWFNRLADPNEQWASTPHVFLYVVGAGFLFFIYSVAMRPATRLQRSFRDHLLPIVFGFIKDVRYVNGQQPGSFDRLPAEAVGSFNRQRFDDVVSGSYAGFSFELYEANLRQKAGKTESTVFKGIIVAFEAAAPFPGLLIATRRSNMVASFFRGIFGGKALEEVTSGSADLDETYDFRTDNPTAALPLVRGRLAQALEWLGEAWPDEPARVALRGADGFLLLPVSRDFFELPGVSVPLDYKAHIEPIIADMASLLATAALVRKVNPGADA